MLTERDRFSIPSLGAERFLEAKAIGTSVPFLSVEGLRPDAASSQKAFGMGLFLSIVFHVVLVAIILQASIMPMGMEGGENRVEVELISPPPAAEPAQPVAEPEPPKLAEPEKPKPIPEKPKEAPQPVKRNSAPRLPSVANDAPPNPQPEPANAAVSMTADHVEPPQPASTTAPATGHASGEDAMQAYARTLWAQIISHKPRGIRFQGTVMLSFSLSIGGDLLSAEVSRSSGMGSLDQAALGALKDAAPFSLPPEGVTAEQLRFTIPFTFQ